MRRSFGGSSGMGMGRGGAGAGGGGGFGGSSGGGGMFRTVSRVGTASVSTSSPSSSSSSSYSSKRPSKRGLSMGTQSASGYSNLVALSDSSFNLGFGASWPSSSFSDEPDWIYVQDAGSFETEIESFDDCVFGSAPSPTEAHAALLSLQQTLSITRHSDSNLIEPSSSSPHYWEQSISPGISRVYDAFHLLQTEPSVQRMVISLSSDKAVWNAVLNNQAVKEVRDAFCKDEANALGNSGSESNPSKSPTNVLSWILSNMRAKFMDFLEGITTLITNQFNSTSENHQENSESIDDFDQLVKSAFMLTAIVMLIVVVTRASHA